MGELIQDLKRELREEILQGMSYERQMTDEELAQVIDGKILEQDGAGTHGSQGQAETSEGAVRFLPEAGYPAGAGG